MTYTSTPLSVRTAALLVALCMTIVGLSCERWVDSKDPVRSLPEGPGIPTGVSAALLDKAVQLSWTLSNTQGVSRYRIYATTDTLQGFLLADSSAATTIVLDRLTNNRIYYFQVAAVGPDGIEGYRSPATLAPVTDLAARIDNGAEYTRDRSVNIGLFANTFATEVELSEDPDFVGATPEPFATNMPFTLSAGDGAKTVYARLTFSNDLTAGEVLSDDIILDSRAEIASVTFLPTGQTFTTGNEIEFFVDGGEIGGTAQVSIGGSSVVLLDDGVDPDVTADDGVYSGRLTVLSELSVTSEPAQGRFVDKAGNQAIRDSDDLLTINP